MVRCWPVVFLLDSSMATVEAQPVFRGRVDLVRVGVTVVDAAGDPVEGLSVEDFVVTEDTRREMITYVSSGVASNLDTMPFHLGVLFDSKVRVSRFSQRDFPRLVQRLRGQEAKGLTALYDALGVYLDGAFDQDGRKVLLLCADGSDTRSRLRLNELLELVRASDVTIYAIGFQTQNRTADRMMTRRRLEEIVELTGGQAYFPGSLDDLEAIYQQIRDEMSTRYSLGYVSNGSATDGAWRQVTVTLSESRPELQQLRVRAREGYFAPYFEDGAPDPR